MALRKVEKCEIGIKLIVSTFLTTVLIYISYQCIEKYLDEPIVLETKFTFGDDDVGNISYPAITFCPEGLGYIWPSQGHCGAQTFEMTEFFKDCLKSQSSEDIFQDALDRWQGTNISVWIKSKTKKSVEIPEAMNYNVKYGFCKSYDTTQMLAFTDSSDMPYIEIFIDGNVEQLPWLRCLLHSREDFPDAEWIYPNMAIVPRGIFGEININKKVGYQIQTKHQTCSKVPFNTCKMAAFYEAVLRPFNCKSFMVTEGPFLKNPSYKMQEFCNVSTQLDIAQKRDHFTAKNCHQACKTVIYNANQQMTKKTPDSPHKGTRLRLAYSNPFVEVRTQRFAYNFHNLVGEVGGVLGLTLGLSGFSAISIIFDFLKQYVIG